MSESRDPARDAMPMIREALDNAIGPCPNCRVMALTTALALEIVAATWPEAPTLLVQDVGAFLGRGISIAMQMRIIAERESCGGNA